MNLNSPIVEIASAQNSKIKEVVRLRTERQRRKQNRILIDGLREISRAIRAGFNIEEIFFCGDPLSANSSQEMSALLKSNAVRGYQLSRSAFEKIAYGDRNEGVVAIAIPRERQLNELELGALPLLVVLDGIEKPGNIGAVFRTASAAGVDAILVSNEVCHPFNANAIRASLGTVFEVPFVSTSQPEIAGYLDAKGVSVVTTRVDARKNYYDCDLTGPVAIVMGSEANGVAKEWHSCDSIGIPMDRSVDSLNVSATAAIVSFEAVRQRNRSPD
ncbi:MAG: TrmH family RNA methyltransferase [Planctomycetota bacterium]|nr:TrmH family RNA methyltransferase [Planctomycetota bacterium]